MRILHCVQFYHPAIGGMEEVVKQLSERLVQYGHEVHVMTSKCVGRQQANLNGVNVVEFNLSGNLALGISGDIVECQGFLLREKFDIIVCFAAQQWATDIFFQDDLITKINAKKIFVPTGFSGLYDPRYAQYFENMKKWFNFFDFSVFLSEDYRDIDFARKTGVKRLGIIPNGASEEEFTQKIKNNPSKCFNILHVGNHTGQKGHRELMKIYYHSNVFNSKLLVLGAKKVMGKCYFVCKIRSFFYNLVFKITGVKKKIEVSCLERREVVQSYLTSDLFLFPSNVECSPIVLFEAMASKTPFLTSAAGNSKEIVSWSHGGILLPSKKDNLGNTSVDVKLSTNLLNDLYKNKDKLKELGESGYRAWKERFTWEKISKRYETLYFELMEEEK